MGRGESLVDARNALRVRACGSHYSRSRGCVAGRALARDFGVEFLALSNLCRFHSRSIVAGDDVES